jgi:hypothetical protein
MCLEIIKADVSVSIEASITEKLLRHPRALRKEANVECVGHATTAAHLNAFVADKKTSQTILF